MMPVTPDPDARRRRRALLRAHHPDLGGDPEQFIRVMAGMPTGHPAADSPEVRFVRRPRGLARIATWLRHRRRPRRPRVL